MAYLRPYRVAETATTTGTGAITLAGAVTGYLAFAAELADADTATIVIEAVDAAGRPTGAFEICDSTFTAPATLSRGNIRDSSAGGSRIDLAAGNKRVFAINPRDLVDLGSADLIGTLPVTKGGTGVTTSTGTGTVVLSASPTFTGTVNVNNLTASATLSTSGVLQTSGFATVSLIATGTIIIGAANATNSITLGRSTATQTTSIQAGATTSGNTKTINLGTGGLAGSTTTIIIGSTDGTSTTTVNGAVLFASTIAAPLGSAAAPSYTFTGDTNTGMFSPGADTLAFSEGGVEAMRIDSAGNVGIGTNSPTLGKLVVSQASSGTATLALESQGSWNSSIAANSSGNLIFNNNAATERMRITAAGNVGIGTSSPLYQATVLGLGQDTAALTDAGNKGGSLYLQATGVTSGSGGALLFGTTFGNQTPFAAIKGLVTDGTANTLGDLAISTRNAFTDTALTERMRITTAGNVGIGTSSPAARLQLAGTAVGATLRLENQTASTGKTYDIISGDGGPLRFQDITAGAERMRITSAGKVGIGTSSPDATAILDVSSTTAGFLPPRMSTAERDAIGAGAPQEGLILYNVTTDKLQVYAAGSWVNLH